MFQEYFASRAELLVWPLVGLAIFFTSFVLVLAYVKFGLGDRAKREHLAALPLDEGRPVR